MTYSNNLELEDAENQTPWDPTDTRKHNQERRRKDLYSRDPEYCVTARLQSELGAPQYEKELRSQKEANVAAESKPDERKSNATCKECYVYLERLPETTPFTSAKSTSKGCDLLSMQRKKMICSNNVQLEHSENQSSWDQFDTKKHILILRRRNDLSELGGPQYEKELRSRKESHVAAPNKQETKAQAEGELQSACKECNVSLEINPGIKHTCSKPTCKLCDLLASLQPKKLTYNNNLESEHPASMEQLDTRKHNEERRRKDLSELGGPQYEKEFRSRKELHVAAPNKQETKAQAEGELQSACKECNVSLEILPGIKHTCSKPTCKLCDLLASLQPKKLTYNNNLESEHPASMEQLDTRKHNEERRRKDLLRDPEYRIPLRLRNGMGTPQYEKKLRSRKEQKVLKQYKQQIIPQAERKFHSASPGRGLEMVPGIEHLYSKPISKGCDLLSSTEPKPSTSWVDNNNNDVEAEPMITEITLVPECWDSEMVIDETLSQAELMDPESAILLEFWNPYLFSEPTNDWTLDSITPETESPARGIELPMTEIEYLQTEVESTLRDTKPPSRDIESLMTVIEAPSRELQFSMRWVESATQENNLKEGIVSHNTLKSSGLDSFLLPTENLYENMDIFMFPDSPTSSPLDIMPPNSANIILLQDASSNSGIIEDYFDSEDLNELENGSYFQPLDGSQY